MNIENLTFNYSSAGGTRREQLHGRDYIVAPMAMLTEGVHNGSGGPLYYPEKECRAAVQSWNMRPVVVYHPEINGQGVSACDPEILEKQQVGMVLNTVWDGKLRAEAWLEADRLSAVDNRILDALEQNKMMEVSTGLFTDNEPEPGTYGTEAYTHIARNHRPDHLAILPDRVGACSIADGAGLLQLNEEGCCVSCGSQPDDLSVEKATELVARLQTHIKNHSTPNHEEQTMANKELIDALIANDATQWAEGDREILQNMDDDTLAKMAPVAVEPAPVEPAPVEEPAAEETTESIVTMEQYVAQAPAQFQDVIRNGLAAHEAQKAELIATITANEANQFSKEFLQTKGLQELQGLAAIAAAPEAAPQAFEAAPVPMFNGAATPAKPTNNVSNENDLLIAPALSWD